MKLVSELISFENYLLYVFNNSELLMKDLIALDDKGEIAITRNKTMVLRRKGR
jgi:hypothetical protein